MPPKLILIPILRGCLRKGAFLWQVPDRSLEARWLERLRKGRSCVEAYTIPGVVKASLVRRDREDCYNPATLVVPAGGRQVCEIQCFGAQLEMPLQGQLPSGVGKIPLTGMVHQTNDLEALSLGALVSATAVDPAPTQVQEAAAPEVLLVQLVEASAANSVASGAAVLATEAGQILAAKPSVAETKAGDQQTAA
jgi:hypothetical protein|mmetsp:Transcript_89077/g.139527  ORF Transcript_89077/g.139527 Transcript_89077/m.139527 type:complete len:194 (+) Transcript_89077:1335-1916(+)